MSYPAYVVDEPIPSFNLASTTPEAVEFNLSQHHIETAIGISAHPQSDGSKDIDFVSTQVTLVLSMLSILPTQLPRKFQHPRNVQVTAAKIFTRDGFKCCGCTANEVSSLMKTRS